MVRVLSTINASFQRTCTERRICFQTEKTSLTTSRYPKSTPHLHESALEDGSSLHRKETQHATIDLLEWYPQPTPDCPRVECPACPPVGGATGCLLTGALTAWPARSLLVAYGPIASGAAYFLRVANSCGAWPGGSTVSQRVQYSEKTRPYFLRPYFRQ